MLKQWFVRSVLVVAAVILSACGESGAAAAAPEKVAETFIHELFEGDIEKSVGMIDFSDIKDSSDGKLTKEDAEKKLTLMLGMLQEEVKKAGGVESVKAGEVSYNADKTEANVPVTVTMKKEHNGKKIDTQNVHLRKIDGEWKVLMK